MKRVSKYQSNDGQLFDSQAEAKQHELGNELEATLRDICSGTILTDGRSLIHSIVNVPGRAKEVRDALNAYLRKMPKQDEAQAQAA